MLGEIRVVEEGMERQAPRVRGREDERTRRVHRVLERLIAANHLEKGVLGGKWEVMVVDSLGEFCRSLVPAVLMRNL